MGEEKKKSLFKNDTNKAKPSGLRTGRNAKSGIMIKKKDSKSIPKENPLLSQAPEGSKSWNAFKSISKISQVNPQDYVRAKDESKMSDYINFRNW